MANAYEIAIKLSMVNGVSPVLAAIGADLLKLQGYARSLETALGGVGTSLKAIGLGAAGVWAGVEGLKGLSAIADKGKEYLHQQALMEQQG